MRFVFRLIALAGFFVSFTMPVQADVDSSLRGTLIEKALAQNLTYHQAPFANPSESKSSASKSKQQIGSLSASLRLLLILPIRLHREVITFQDGDVCSFQPSCSRYGLTSIQRYGLKGILMASDRLLRCHSGNHRYYPVMEGSAHDPVP
ncbi:MAG: membrane protein insertion efficiency factor YidD [Candidatus Poribacteria bacterium]|nr:membrane protein insertion efficiency factor YidD [Candidatus Poribacteria bacterium]MDE0505777.1 membrane protein insertion efficiency factor YidD [Candidatus Poribacteria bacterium]